MQRKSNINFVVRLALHAHEANHSLNESPRPELEADQREGEKVAKGFPVLSASFFFLDLVEEGRDVLKSDRPRHQLSVVLVGHQVKLVHLLEVRKRLGSTTWEWRRSR